MNQDGKGNRIEGIDQIGKVFLVVSTDAVGLRKCLICEVVFTYEEAREHYASRCQPSPKTDLHHR